MNYRLPVNYDQLAPWQRREVREQYVLQQRGRCMYCDELLEARPSADVELKYIDWSLFPPNFLKYPVHLQHCHKTGMTEGAVHALCNAVMWQYEGR